MLSFHVSSVVSVYTYSLKTYFQHPSQVPNLDKELIGANISGSCLGQQHFMMLRQYG